MKRRISVLGSTGSVGQATLDVLRAAKDEVTVAVLAAKSNATLLAQQAKEFNAQAVALTDESALGDLRAALSGCDVEVLGGSQALREAAQVPCDWVMIAVVGACGLEATMIAAQAGRTIAFANKECLVCGGKLVMDAVRAHGATLLPVDSEHSALYQLLAQDGRESLSGITLTCSGGPLWRMDREEMNRATREQVLTHPVWSMGEKLTVDSATMMNKGLEVIEAAYLFNLPEPMIDVVIHPQTIVHALTRYRDGAVLAHLGAPDMRAPISYALNWPTRTASIAKPLDLCQVGNLTFEPPDLERFPALNLARQALRDGASAPIILNAANEVAVAAFLAGKISYPQIIATVMQVCDRTPNCSPQTLDAVIDVDEQARRTAHDVLCRVNDH